ncbi:MAG: ribosome biogenesis GTPase YlqF [Methylicorpusculum sp.]|uniref:ribosome biogenesis GTPase YlqF n=1 Tax=Methylicorpusculum sp. TaxID=2713644 RepID=UPI002724E102|nr:ribosome biogenesis GTPase YlqF [Methylicorpusculum sp.]MDO8939187.1 ribosome biogenesis GTPase YlqF [Methylicorpusculum sp.]MDO9240500.1 ribosome biogenesis GTPase YlqF [Methylicorpusculum sp.]MDP2178475.1 ribosome biogenesis GTPase YlqF [Methylicorpusculum sp.]MDP2201570.1 ribosome biogenesis GTPase YlqF [Methylicorpusculum sp.]MDP3528768.1 ribosome biogenesis GTPase YlqF [Methylicorpusculum sp.]
MLIQWYPGHMHKAGKEIKEILPQVDVIIEILDARIPFSSQNPMLTHLRGNKPCIKVFSKSDLADPDLTQQWQHYLEQEQGVKTLALSILHPEKARQIPELCNKLMAAKAESGRLITVMIMGIPNVGKSTLINMLAGKAIAKTGDEPAITRMQQRINIGNNIVLLDTPGVLWPNVENKNSGYRLALTGAIKDTAISHDQIAFFAADYFLKHYPDALKARYSIEPLPSTDHALLNEIGRRRGCLRSGGVVELDKAAKILINELRSGLLGKFTLETPAMMEAELFELVAIREEKEAKKKARKEKWKGGQG